MSRAFGSSSSSSSSTTTTTIFLLLVLCAISTTTVVVAMDVPAYLHSASGTLSGELRMWHKITLGFTGPETFEERGSPNPFTDRALAVNFTHETSGTSMVVPGYFAADGNAANTLAERGNVWLVHFAPTDEGRWNWRATFRAGTNVALDHLPSELAAVATFPPGTSGGSPLDGATGSFEVGPTDKTGRDMRSKGLLQYVGRFHYRFAGNGEWFLKAGTDSPENFLAYDDFDGTTNTGNSRFPEGLRKSWEPHQQDFKVGDPTWDGGRGSEIMGAVNYLAEVGLNAFSFLTLSLDGDDKNVFPFVSRNPGMDRLRYDVSKLAQWEVLFEHANTLGMYLHFKTQEQENDQLLDGGELGLERKMYYRELIARFGHHLALNWNIGEENTNTQEQRLAFARYFKEVDPYRHPIVIHSFPFKHEDVYPGLLGEPDYDGASLQIPKAIVFDRTLEWRTKSEEAGHPWVVANDEQGDNGVWPDEESPRHDAIRKNVLWANLMAGGAGVEYYYGYQFRENDLSLQDFRSRANMWPQTRHAMEFFRTYVPFWTMRNQQSLLTFAGSAWALVGDGIYVIYLKDGEKGHTIDLEPGFLYSIKWFDPFLGGNLQDGSLTLVEGTENAGFGSPPSLPRNDWAVLIRRIAVATSPMVSPTAPPSRDGSRFLPFCTFIGDKFCNQCDKCGSRYEACAMGFEYCAFCADTCPDTYVGNLLPGTPPKPPTPLPFCAGRKYCNQCAKCDTYELCREGYKFCQTCASICPDEYNGSAFD